MPTTYAHDVFGKMVFQKLPDDMKQIVTSQRAAYLIGLHGPDILFYYKPFGHNSVNEKGYSMHKAIASEFFSNCKKRYIQTRNETLLSYVLGFICHYMLDSTCHPYIGQYIEKTGAPHDEIETEFDRFLMEHYNKNPFKYHPSDSIHIENEVVLEISGIIEDISEQDVRKCLKSMKFYTNTMVCASSFKRYSLLKMMHAAGVYDSMQGHIMRRKKSKRCEESTDELYRLLKLAVPETVSVVEEYYKTIEDKDYLNYRFERNYE